MTYLRKFGVRLRPTNLTGQDSVQESRETRIKRDKFAKKEQLVVDFMRRVTTPAAAFCRKSDIGQTVVPKLVTDLTRACLSWNTGGKHAMGKEETKTPSKKAEKSSKKKDKVKDVETVATKES
jgi:hypothetical protein